MRALVIHAPKDLRAEDWQEEAPGEGQVLIRMEAGGVCGSDLHYYNHGGFGPVRIKEPMVLGHEVSGRVAALGSGVAGLSLGDLVAINPSRPCGTCGFCTEGAPNHCLNMRFYGSAMPFPHIQGAFRQEMVADASQCVKADGLSAGEAAMAEPLSVALHATRRAGALFGKRVLVTGCGPIGVLAVLAARRAGAAEIVATDLEDKALSHAAGAGADRTINVVAEPDALESYAAGKGHFDVLYEASGAQPALVSALAAMRPRGVVVQLGMGGDMTLPMMQITAKELELRGSFRFHEEFPLAVEMMSKGLIDVKPLITHTIAFDRAIEAFELAGDRSQVMKAQIAFN
ncbi:L-idonate 5-dehydrogenase [Pelagibius litoralis]|uniref:L-idonate 5-dehydrogenase n=1 Tax=Pelagibius litoralis TaxID=374515 RepID=A0A967KD14_9PROT|nr:L-idonate 5-dehydrogenase [Pelagibius litoralis]NIA69975.1 L-idonate 5-dehydrogenase [Pelagibius litoralis]